MIRQRTLRSLESAGSGTADDIAGWGVLLSLVELYWFSMQRLMEILVSSPEPTPLRAPEPHKGDSE
jgi:hypothetical protein